MKRLLINAAHADELRVATTDDAILIDLNIENPELEQKKSNIYKGKITSIEPSLGAVFVDYGSERHGFLPLKEVSPEYYVSDCSQLPLEEIDIRKALREGQEIVVQVDKEERGTKGAALTTFITLAGSYLVLMPNNPRSGGISRRIEGEDRDHLKEVISKLDIPEGMGIIIRTAGVGKTSEELSWDLSVLLRYWEAIKQAAVAKPGPYLIHQESDMIIRTIRDNLRQDINEIIIDDVNAFNRAKDYIRQIRPDFTQNVKHYDDHLPLFSRFQIERQIEAAYQREVRLPSGGSIVIDHSEALVAIDINSARATKGTSIEETALATNLEAADEIAKQLRIRDIGGLVVIDFIDMTPTKNQREVENRLRDALHMDRARIQIGRISRFGLLEMSRQRLRSSLSMSTQITCPRCDGRGTIRGVESIALSIIHLLQENASRTSNAHLQIQLPINVATYIMNEKRNLIESLEAHSSVKVTIIPNQHLKSPHYQLKTCKDEHSKSIPSYKLVKIPKADTTPKKSANPANLGEPAIQQYLSEDAHAPAPRKAQNNGLIKRLWELMFSTPTPDQKSPETKKVTTPISDQKKTPTTSTQRKKDGANHGQRRQQTQQKNRKSSSGDQKQTTRPKRAPQENTPNNKQQERHSTSHKDEGRTTNTSKSNTSDANENEKTAPNKKDFKEKPPVKHKEKKTHKQKPVTNETAEKKEKTPENATPTKAGAGSPKPTDKQSSSPKAEANSKKSEPASTITDTQQPKAVSVQPTQTKEEKVPSKVTETQEEKKMTAKTGTEETKAAVSESEKTMTAPTQSASSYQQSSYKGLSSGKALQQVTTRKTVAEKVDSAKPSVTNIAIPEQPNQNKPETATDIVEKTDNTESIDK